MGAWFDRVGALRDAEQVSPGDVEAAGEGLLRAAAKNPYSMSFVSPNGGSSFALVVADLHATKGVRPDRLPDLVRDGIPELELLRTIGLPSDLYPRPDVTDSLERARWSGRATIADIWVKVKDKDTFPVIPAGFLVHELVPSLGIPLNWIVDAAGVVRQERVGFGGSDGDKWADQAVEAIEKARAGPHQEPGTRNCTKKKPAAIFRQRAFVEILPAATYSPIRFP